MKDAPPLVVIEWEDSAQPVAAWQYMGDLEPPEIVKCQSVGFLVHDGDDVKAHNRVTMNAGQTLGCANADTFGQRRNALDLFLKGENVCHLAHSCSERPSPRISGRQVQGILYSVIAGHVEGLDPLTLALGPDGC